MDHPPDGLRGSPSPRRRRGLLPLVTIASWIVVLVTWFFINVLWAWLWVLAFVPVVVVALVSAVLTMTWAVRSALDRRFVRSCSILVAAAAIALVPLQIGWSQAYSRIWFALHRAEFVEAEAQVRSGAIDPTVDYYGADLPLDLAAISITGTISATEPWDTDEGSTPCDRPIEFVPATVGIPDGATGFVHLPCDEPPPGFIVNGFDDGIYPRIRLGDGWWWADGQVPDEYLLPGESRPTWP